ncbi:RCC1 domain-containing protein [Cystobacter fuscus]|uniref:RCC1 domain-containing protein n=1 Tax=Cystobacter fuscus TaxID=43 RepID=UPI0027958E3A|nr:RCC1 domain-containing protein [Cystobacter fuscus]
MQVQGLSGVVAAGSSHSVAVRSDGAVLGYNSYGQLGHALPCTQPPSFTLCCIDARHRGRRVPHPRCLLVGYWGSLRE